MFHDKKSFLNVTIEEKEGGHPGGGGRQWKERGFIRELKRI